MVCPILKFHREQKFIICALFIPSPYFLNQGISKILLFYLPLSDHTVYEYCWDQAEHRDSQFLRDSQPWSRSKKESIYPPHLHYEDLLRKASSFIQQSFPGHECLKMNLPWPRNSAITCQSIHLCTPPSAPSHFSPCVCQENSLQSHPREVFPTHQGRVCVPAHTQTTHAVWMMLSQVKGPHAYSAEEIFVSVRNHANSY